MSSSGFFVQPPVPKTRLGRHRQLAPLAGMHVSPLCLGAMSIGDKWEKMGFGAMDKASSFTLLDAFYEAGGNFIDTANNYQDETSEEFIGEWMEKRGIRDQMVIATKVSRNPEVWYSAMLIASLRSTRRTTSAGGTTSRRRRTTPVTTSNPCTSLLRPRSRSCARAILTSFTCTG